MSSLTLYCLTYNCGRALIQPEYFAPHVFDALSATGPSPDIISLTLQEIAPIGYAFLGGSFLTPYFNAFRHAVKLASKAFQTSYINVVSRNVGMTAIMIFIRHDLASNITWLQTAGIGVGLQEMGNKGAVGVRMGFRAADDHLMQMTFVSAHLAPMEDGLSRRNEDYESIAKGLVFVSEKPRKPLSQDEQGADAPLLQELPETTSDSQSGLYSPNSYLFFAGDLNYRTSERKPTLEDYHQRFPQPTENKNDAKHFSSLFLKDQLTQQLKAGKTLQGLTEPEIDFPPTYKYHQDISRPVVLDAEQWNWASHRWPSWCDRILYLNLSKIQPLKYTALPLFSTSDHRPVALAFSIPAEPVSAASLRSNDVWLNPPFEIDAHWKSRRDLARKKEIAVGLAAYLGWTWEGNGLLLATIVGVFGGWLIIRSLLSA